ncbi:MAG: pyridoxal phosphate-dependent aminotransferase [Alphaproteobacteria bacterium]|nr:MAG: pyridoxal phosphate-dependent aminotransferase [Alphaproteobacteria bacterium]
MTGPRLTPLAAALPASVPFVGPEAQERALGRPFRARIGANESVFGPSPAAIAAMRAAAAEAWKYGDPECFDLRGALAGRHGVARDNIVVGEGIDGLLGYLVRLLVAPQTPVVTTAGSYPTFNYHVVGHGGRLAAVPYRDDRVESAALADAARATGAPLVFLANPDNPTGSWIPAEEIIRLLDALPEGCLLCLDEAYADFAPPGALPPIDADDPRVIRMRTFSKAHGLAGLRVGYAIAEAGLAAAFNKVRNHFGVGRVAQAGAMAALGDNAWVDSVVARVAEARARIAETAAANGLRALPSATNFVALDTGRDGAFARRLLQALAERGVFVRMGFAPPQDRCIRVTAGTAADLDAFAAALPEALAALG